MTRQPAATTTALDDLRDTWSRVMAHLPELERTAKRMASCDRRLDAQDLLADAIADIVESDRRLYDSARGPWIRWAKTRVWKTRTYALRAANAHAPRGRATIGQPERDESGMATALDLPVPTGAEGQQDRSEARIVLSELLEEATEDEMDAVLVLLHGWQSGRPAAQRAATARLVALGDRCRYGWHLP